MAEVLLRDLTKSFDHLKALDSLSLQIHDREFVVLLGPSGCGKTTALRCVAGLEIPDSGEIYVGGEPVNDLAPKERDVAIVFQNYALYPHMTVSQNLEFPLKIRTKSRQTIEGKVKEVAMLLRIEHLLSRKPKQLSGGEQQRVALGRALVREPEVFLMDEPLSNLDAALRLYMRAELKRLQKELGITTIYVTHDQAEAMTMADRIAVLNKGLLQQFDSPNGIYNRPKNTFVAGFVGSPPMNFVSAALTHVSGERRATILDTVMTLPRDELENVKLDSKVSQVILGIRPEDVFLSDQKLDKNSFKTEVYIVEPLGSETIVDVKLGEKVLKVKTKSDFNLPIGTTVYVNLEPEKIHLFGEADEKSLMRAVSN